MADNQLLLKKNADDGFFADDDPLAELARIVGFESPADSHVRPPAAARREPEFDLEDELLKEFEQYEVPENVDARQEFAADLPPLADAPQPITAVEPVVVAEPVPVLAVPQKVVAQPAALDVVAEAPIVADPGRSAAHPVFELEDEILREFAAFDARRSGQGQAESGPQLQALPVEPSPSMDLIDQLIAEFTPQAVVAPQAHVEVPQPPVREPAEDAAAMLLPEFFAPEAEEEAADEPEDPRFAEHWHEANGDVYAGGEAAPVTNDFEEFVEEPVHFEADFHAEQGWDDNAETVAPSDEPTQAAPHYFGIQPTFPTIEPAAAEVAVEALPEPEKIVEAAAPVVESGPVVARRDYELDALLGEVERYPVGGPVMQWPRSTPIAADLKPEISDTPVARADEIVAAPVAASIAEPVENNVAVVAPVAAEQDASSGIEDVPLHDAFDDGAFELDLSEIELDLLEVETLTDEVARLDAVSASAASLSAMADVSVAEKTLPAVETAPEPVFAAPPQVEDYSALPFDPTQISSEEDPVEAISDMDVPEILQEHHASTVPAAQPDYDIDIDAEMAHLFNRSSIAPVRSSVASLAVNVSAAKPATAAPQSPMADLDDFERALEEDFRKSMKENRAVSSPDRVALSPAGFPLDGGERSTSRRLMVLAASVAAIVLLGGAGVYAFMSGDSSTLQASTEPKIILADKDPVKMVPEDKGGQQVPNQDKAVYDRVSGEQPEVGKQERLVTSNEEPVDVVQKTLMPESLPMDDENGAGITPTDDTADPRLLPENAAKDNVTTSEKVTSGVAPRKVRTMVVRADGTLVPREELAAEEPVAKVEDQSQSLESSVELAKAEPVVVPERLAESASDSVASEINAAQPLVPAPEEKVAEPVVQPVETPVEKPVAAEETPVVAEQTPATAEDQPAKVEEPILKSEIKPVVAEDVAPQAEDPVDAQRALDDAAKAQQTALAEAANAEVDAPVRAVKTTKIVNENMPIPENRPVDQPVDIVGTVTDQGNVKQATNDSQQVAAAEPVVQPEKTTTVPAGSYVIQIASLPSEAEAQTSYAKLSSKFSSVIGGKGVDIKRAQIKNKGTYYRVRIPAGTKQEAAALCDRYKKAGGSCLVSK